MRGNPGGGMVVVVWREFWNVAHLFIPTCVVECQPRRVRDIRANWFLLYSFLILLVNVIRNVSDEMVEAGMHRHHHRRVIMDSWRVVAAMVVRMRRVLPVRRESCYEVLRLEGVGWFSMGSSAHGCASVLVVLVLYTMSDVDERGSHEGVVSTVKSSKHQ